MRPVRLAVHARFVSLGAAVALLLALGLLPGGGRRAEADKVDDLISKLRGDTDYKVRLSAALNLGKLADRRAVPALVDGLGDADKSVRAVAAGALGKLVDAQSDAEERARAQLALDGVASNDPEASVRSLAQRSLDSIRALPAYVASGKGVYVELGGLGDKTKKGDAVLPLMRQSLVSGLTKKPGIQVRWPTGRSPTELELKKAGTAAFYLDASLTRVDAAGAHVSCGVSVVVATYPAKSMFGFANGSAELDARSSAAPAINEALGDCVTAVVDDLMATKIVPTILARVP
jgi:hypothetical protein